VLAFDVVSVGGGDAGFGFGLFWFLGGVQASGAVVAAFFYVVVLGERRDHGGASVELADAVQDDFRAAVIHLYGAIDFYDAPFEAADVADIFEVVREDYNGEGAGCFVFAEVYEVDAFESGLYAVDLAGDALDFADVMAGFVDGDAVGGEERDGEQRQEQNPHVSGKKHARNEPPSHGYAEAK
jgi:hypothetical protein